MFRFLMTCVMAVTVLSACGGNKTPQDGPKLPDFPVPKPNPIDRAKFLEQFALLNSAGEEAAPIHPDFAGHPLGVLIAMPDSGQGTFCSASHLEGGYVATNAHCVPDWKTLGPDKYYVVFFDPDGLKKWSPVESFTYVGNANSDDIAILKIPAAAASLWETAGKTAKAVPVAQPTAEVQNPTPLAFPIHIWAFDPFSPSHPEILAQFKNRPGMIFKPRTCQMSRTRPKIVGAKVPDIGNIQRTTITSTNANPAIHFFIDQCDRIPVHGNSGSLVTVAEHFDQKIGVYHWGIGTRDGKPKYDYLEYTGNDGHTRFLHDAADWSDVFGVGYLFDHFRTSHPNLFF